MPIRPIRPQPGGLAEGAHGFRQLVLRLGRLASRLERLTVDAMQLTFDITEDARISVSPESTARARRKCARPIPTEPRAPWARDFGSSR